MNLITPQKVLHLHLEQAKKKPKLGYNYMITEKLDGWYTEIYYDAARCVWSSIFSSNQREIPSFLDKVIDFYSIPKPRTSGKLIMEATIPGMDFYQMNGIFNRKFEQCENVVFNIHDWIEYDNNLTALERFRKIKEIPNFSNIRTVNLLAIANEPKIWDSYFDSIVENGGEGIILKNELSLYEPGKRNSNLIKKKLLWSGELLAVGVEEGEGKYAGTTGKLICQRKSGKIIAVSGMTDYQRHNWWTNPSEIVGKIVEVEAMKEVEPGGALREARFKAIRYDKTIEDIC